MHQFKKLKVWHMAMDLTTDIYNLTTHLPPSEEYGLKSQMKRAVVSIPSNIAEGAGRGSKGEWKYFLGVANGSLFELHTQLLLSQRLYAIPDLIIEPIEKSLKHIQNMIFKLLSSI